MSVQWGRAKTARIGGGGAEWARRARGLRSFERVRRARGAGGRALGRVAGCLVVCRHGRGARRAVDVGDRPLDVRGDCREVSSGRLGRGDKYSKLVKTMWRDRKKEKKVRVVLVVVGKLVEVFHNDAILFKNEYGFCVMGGNMAHTGFKLSELEHLTMNRMHQKKKKTHL